MAERDPIRAIAEAPDIQPLLAINYMRPHIRKEYRRDIDDGLKALNDPFRRAQMANPGKLEQQIGRQKALLDMQTPPETLPPGVRERLVTLNRLCKASIREGMPTDEQMRRNTPGAGDQQRAWHKAKKHEVQWYKRSTLLLNPDAGPDMRDLCNIETLRPSTATRHLDVNAQIPGVFSLSPEAKSHYDDIDWGDPAVLARAKAELATRGEIKRDGYTVKKAKQSSLHPFVGANQTKAYDCTEHEKFWSGPMAKLNHARHMKSAAHAPEG